MESFADVLDADIRFVNPDGEARKKLITKRISEVTSKLRSKGITLTVGSQVVDMLEEECRRIDTGAGGILRLVEREVEERIIQCMYAQKDLQSIRITVDNEGITTQIG